MKTSSPWKFTSLFGCHHRHVSRVFTIKRRTYQVCCDCGEEFQYSWDRMHREKSGVAAAEFQQAFQTGVVTFAQTYRQPR